MPKRFRHEILAYVHNRCGHYAAQALFHTLAARYFWKKLFSDAVAYCTTCSSCQKTKINYSHRYVPLHPLRVPDELGSRFSMDHKILTRITKLGNTAILVVECFSNFAHLPVRDTTAEVTARALVANIVPLWGIGWTLYSDKAPAFMSTLFAQVNKCLGIRHITSAARTARCNGMAEATVKRLSEHLKFYAKDDLSVEDAIPIIEMNLRATSLTKLMISPYEIVFGRCLRLGAHGEPNMVLTETNTDRLSYYRWLLHELQRLHKAVKTTREQIKITEKQTYDKSHRVKTPCWKVGDRVLIREDSLRPGSPVVLTRKRFAGPFVINNVVKGHDDVEIAYELKNESTGKLTRNLVSSDRLKAYNTDREQFTKRLPRLEIASKSLKQETLMRN